MSREIDFRIWDNFQKKYLTGLMEQVEILEMVGFNDSDGRMIWEQFTGASDKNGKRIFEGDIVKWGEDISQIVYQDRGFWVESESFGYEGEDLWNWREIEIVGNIHENPELIK